MAKLPHRPSPTPWSLGVAARRKQASWVGGPASRDRCASCLAIEVNLTVSDHPPSEDRGTLRRWCRLPGDPRELASQGRSNPCCVGLGDVCVRSGPLLVDSGGEHAVPAIEVFGGERQLIVDVPVGIQDRPSVRLIAQQHATPVVDQLRNMLTPVDLGDLFEDRSENFVHHQLAIERHDHVVNLSSRIEISVVAGLRAWFAIGCPEWPLLADRHTLSLMDQRGGLVPNSYLHTAECSRSYSAS